MRHISWSFAAAVSLAFFIASCGGGGGGGETPSNAAFPADSTTVANGHVEITKSVRDATGSTYLDVKSSDSITSIGATVAVVNYSADGALPRARVRGVFYNDGTAGSGAGNSIGDINAGVSMTNSEVRYQIVRCIDTICNNVVILFDAQLGTVKAYEQHSLFINWDNASGVFSFQLDGNTPVVVDPKPVAPVVQSRPNRRFVGIGVKVNASSGQSGTMTAQFDNVFINQAHFDDFSGNVVDSSKWAY